MKTFLISLRTLLLFTFLTGILYPVIITVISQVAFPGKASGSLIREGDRLIGSALIGQQFDSPVYFSSRPSATQYNTLPSGGSNYGLTSAELKNKVTERRNRFISANMLDPSSEIPSEMLFASASGLDPHISPGAALMQVDRVASSRNFNDRQKEELTQLVRDQVENPQFLIFGEPRINVLLLNLRTDSIK